MSVCCFVWRRVGRVDHSFPCDGSGGINSRFWDQNLNLARSRPGASSPPSVWTPAIPLALGPGVVDELIVKVFRRQGPAIGGSLATAGGLVFIGATNDKRFRAFDKDTGKEIWTTQLPASAHATPMTFLGKKSSKQFVVISAGGGNKYNSDFSDSLVAFSLP
jgi:quinoprotein glucose dehydrogenase